MNKPMLDVGRVRRSALKVACVLCAGLAAGGARADAVDALKAFAHDVQSGRAAFTQTVTSPDGMKKKQSSGRFEFARPNRFRFSYLKPFEQTIVADGQKVWLYDPDLNQVSTRTLGQALGATPAALLAGAGFERDFELSAQPNQDGLEWVQALPKQKDSGFARIRVGFKGRSLASLEITDALGQRSLLQFNDMAINPVIAPEVFKFTVPSGADVLGL